MAQLKIPHSHEALAYSFDLSCHFNGQITHLGVAHMEKLLIIHLFLCIHYVI